MSAIYELIGRFVVNSIRWRYRAQIRNAAFVGAGLAALAAVAYVATREGETED